MKFLNYMPLKFPDYIISYIGSIKVRKKGMGEQPSDAHLQTDETEKLTYLSHKLAFKLEMEKFPLWSNGKESAFQCRGRRFNPWSGN